jgi:hypothetical protein
LILLRRLGLLFLAVTSSSVAVAEITSVTASHQPGNRPVGGHQLLRVDGML